MGQGKHPLFVKMENMTTYVNAYGTVPVKRKKLVILGDIKNNCMGEFIE